MDEKNGKKIVAGIATRRISGKREREILLVEEEGRWELPKVRVSEEMEGLKELETYMSETLGMGKIGIKNLYGTVRDHEGNGKTIEAHLVTVYRGSPDPINGENSARWFSRGKIKDYDISHTTSRIIRSLRKNSYF